LSKSLRIIQITDCHLPADPAQHYRGINAHQNLKDLIKKVATDKPDLLLLTGDLSEDASRASYAALKTCFNTLDIPVLALPGNHDDFEMVLQTFPGSPVDEAVVTTHGEWQIIRLNSCLAGKPEGRLSTTVLQQLREILAADPWRPRLIALHHQPVPAESPWIDKYRLFEPQAFMQIVAQSPAVKAVVWGHIHQVHETTMNGVALMGSPSSAINSEPGMETFTASSSLGPACRWLELYSDGKIESGIIKAD
jgi:Icc protein